ncbi:NYN domain-containing protein [Dichomitus squalens]|uniref:NYN domain-containing protein n=1 Tax=Dichomitus squalens TaxID=114155 RepID=A0A4Q9QE61_9APHY|nr:NYN domain-containing protein [Dichomitus squalens]TBU66123.1 NYN domain-containing protein [Dichomitus squalens]
MSHSFDEHVAIFWDYENCAPPTSTPGYDVVSNIRQVAHEYGSVKLFKAYLELSEQSSSKSIGLRSELQSCGVSLTDCPHNGRKDVADKMMIVDMLTYAIDNPAPATIVLISGDRDFVYAVSVLRLRRYRVVLVAPNCAHASLKSQASAVLNWETDIMGKTNPRPQTLDAPNSCSDDAPQRSPRRTSFGSQLPHFTAKHARRPSFKTNTPITPVTPDTGGGQGDSFFGGRHLRNPSIVTTVECFVADTHLHGRMESISTQPPIPDIVDFIQDIKGAELRLPAPDDEPSAYVSHILQTSATLLAPVSAANPTSAPPSSRDSTNGAEPASAPPDRLNAPPLIAPEPIAFPRLAFEEPILRPATVEPLSRVPSESSQSSVSGSAVSSSSGDLLRTPDYVLAEALDVTPPTPALDVDESPITPIADPVQALPPTAQEEPTPHSPPVVVVEITAPVPPPVSFAPNAVPSSIPHYFHPLVKALEESRMSGSPRPLRSWVGLKIPRGIYTQANVPKFKQYAAAAEQAGLVELGGVQSSAWISLRPEWYGKIPVHPFS